MTKAEVFLIVGALLTAGGAGAQPGADAPASAWAALRAQAPEGSREAAAPETPRAIAVAAEAAQAGEDSLDIENPAHLATFVALGLRGQNDKLFTRSARIKIESLPFWREDGGNSATRALRMALALDGMFTGYGGAKRTSDRAPFVLAQLLVSGKDAGHDLRAFADAVGALYDFSAAPSLKAAR